MQIFQAKGGRLLAKGGCFLQKNNLLYPNSITKEPFNTKYPLPVGRGCNLKVIVLLCNTSRRDILLP
jgi:hypothetical protein